MADFPTTIKTFVNPTTNDRLDDAASDVDHATQHSEVNDEVAALQAKVGVDNSAVVTSHDYLIRNQIILEVAPFKAHIVTVRNQTTDATPKELFLDGSTTRIPVASDTAIAFTAMVVARRSDADDESAFYEFKGVIDNNAGTTALAGPTTMKLALEDTSAWNMTVTADNGNSALVFTVTGEGGKTINWLAIVTLAEITA